MTSGQWSPLRGVIGRGGFNGRPLVQWPTRPWEARPWRPLASHARNSTSWRRRQHVMPWSQRRLIQMSWRRRTVNSRRRPWDVRRRRLLLTSVRRLTTWDDEFSSLQGSPQPSFWHHNAFHSRPEAFLQSLYEL